MHDLSRRALLVSVVAASGARLIDGAGAQTEAPPPAAAAPAPFSYQDVVKRARDLAAAPFESAIPPLPDGLANLDFDGWRDIRFKSDKPLLGQEGANFRLELVPSRASLQAAGGRQRAARRHPRADPLCGQSVRLWPHQAWRPAGQPRFRRPSAALSDQRAARLGRSDRVPRRELLPLPWPRAALWPVGARPGDRRGSAPRRGVPVLSRILDRDAGCDGRAYRHLCPARRRTRRPGPSASI